MQKISATLLRRSSILGSFPKISSSSLRFIAPIASRSFNSSATLFQQHPQKPEAPSKPAARSSNSIVHVDETNIQSIFSNPNATIVVQFTASWCAPCKQLGPKLEAAVKKANGSVVLAIIDVDKMQDVAAQLQVRSVPTVLLIHKGQMADSFVGAPSDPDLTKFFENVYKLAGVGGAASSDPLGDAKKALDAGKIEEAKTGFAKVMEDNGNAPVYHRAIAGLARCAIAEGDMATAQEFIGVLRSDYPKLLGDPDVSQAITLLDVTLHRDAAKKEGAANKSAELRLVLESDPNNAEARLELSTQLFLEGSYKLAIDEVLEVIKKNKKGDINTAAKAHLVKIFETLGPQNELTRAGRKRFANLVLI